MYCPIQPSDRTKVINQSRDIGWKSAKPINGKIGGFSVKSIKMCSASLVEGRTLQASATI